MKKSKTLYDKLIKPKVLLGLYGGLGFFYLVLHHGIDWHIRKNAGMTTWYEFSLTEGIMWGIPLGLLVGFLIYMIMNHFEPKSGHPTDLGKRAKSCGALNWIIFLLIGGLFFSPKIGPSHGWVSIVFVLSSIIGISSSLNIHFQTSLKGIKKGALELEHEELRGILSSLIMVTMIALTGVVIITGIHYWEKYLPDVPTPVLHTMAFYAVLIFVIVVGVIGIFLQILGRMKKIRDELS